MSTVPASAAATRKSASQLLEDALQAAQHAGSVQFKDKTTSGKNVQNLEGAISASTASETLSSTGTPLQVQLIGGTAYINGSATALASALQITPAQATSVAGKWIVVSSTDAPFKKLTNALTLSSSLSDFAAKSGHSLHIGKTQHLDGHSVIPIVGVPLQTLSKGTTGSVALYLSPKAPYLPVAGSLVLANKSERLTEVAVFGNWGAKVSLTAPTGGIAFSSIQGG